MYFPKSHKNHKIFNKSFKFIKLSYSCMDNMKEKKNKPQQQTTRKFFNSNLFQEGLTWAYKGLGYLIFMACNQPRNQALWSSSISLAEPDICKTYVKYS